MPFGHRHEDQEEVYVIVRGSARIKVDDEIVEVGEWDAIRFDTNTMRDVEAGKDGVEYMAFSAGEDRATRRWFRTGGATDQRRHRWPTSSSRACQVTVGPMHSRASARCVFRA